MGKYLVHTSDGEILRRFDGDHAGVLLGDGEILLQVDSFDGIGWGTHYCASGAIVKIPVKPAEGYNFNYVLKRWVTNDIDVAKVDRSAVIDSECKAQILGGFDSYALGTKHHYPSNEKDQLNLTGSVIDSTLPGVDAAWTTPFWCSDSNGIWQFRIHSALQIQQVGRDAKAAILAAMGKNEVLQAQIAAAQTLSDVEAISW